MALTAAEQYMLELINRARLDPLAEAARYGIDLNEGLAPGTLTGTARQVLAPDVQLEMAAQTHSEWMLQNDVFSHTGAGGSNAGTRIAQAGYTDMRSWAENLSMRGTTGTLDLEEAIALQHESLFLSEGHRVNTLSGGLREIGIAQVAGQYTSGGTTYNTSMVTQNFGTAGADVFVTGVAYADHDQDAFYSVGEALSGVWVEAAGSRSTTAAAGGYSVAVDPDSAVAVTVGQGGSVLATLTLDLSAGNGKLDLVQNNSGGWSLALSASAVLISGVAEASLLGVADLDLTGHAGANRLSGNKGANRIDGGAGNDLILGGDGDDILIDGAGQDTLTGGLGADVFVLVADGARDTITDFTPRSDQIELVGWVGLSSIGQLVMTQTATGMTVTYGNETLVVQSASGTGINPATLSLADITIVPGSPPEPVPDDITGTADADILTSPGGDARLFGLGGNDTLYGGAGNDRLDGGSGADRMEGGLGNDTYVIDSIGDVIAGEAAAGGHDTVESWISYTLTPGLEVLRLQGTANINGTGTAAADSLVGNPGNNILTGGDGNDVLTAKDGDDTLIGGLGSDQLVGNEGADVFVFRDVTESLPGQDNRDFINGFMHGEDRIDLSGIDADTTLAGDQAFWFIDDDPFSGSAGELRHFTFSGGNYNIVEGDVNGDGLADFQIFVNLTPWMVAGDFIL